VSVVNIRTAGCEIEAGSLSQEEGNHEEHNDQSYQAHGEGEEIHDVVDNAIRVLRRQYKDRAACGSQAF
jgi:hypothetical protein